MPYPTGYRVSLPSPFNSVDFGAGRQQVSTIMAATDRLQSLQITRPVYRLYSFASPKPVTESTHLVHSTVGSGAGRCESISKELLQPTGYGVYRPGAGLHCPYFDSSLPVFPVTENYWLQRKLQFLQTDKSYLIDQGRDSQKALSKNVITLREKS